LLDDRRIRIRIQEAQKHVDPVDPDPDSDPSATLAAREYIGNEFRDPKAPSK
jgi:hypothetical protein